MKDKTQQKGSGHRRYSKLVTETNARAASRGDALRRWIQKRRFSEITGWHRFHMGYCYTMQYAH